MTGIRPITPFRNLPPDRPPVERLLRTARALCGLRPYSLSVMPVSPAREFDAFVNDQVLILLNDPDAAPHFGNDMLRRHHGLSARQAELAMLLAAGNRLGDCAGTLGIAEKTARRHLEVIFARTGVRRQVDLVRLILSMPGQSLD